MEIEDLRVRVVHSRDHHGRKEFRPYVDGQHAVLLEGDDGSLQGELVWRLANIGHGIAEISGFGIADPAMRRKGWGTRLLEKALQDIREFMARHGIVPRLVYLFSNEESEAASAFYQARGFRKLSGVPGLYATGTACILARDLTADRADSHYDLPANRRTPETVPIERLARTDHPPTDDPEVTETVFGLHVTRIGRSALLNCRCAPETVDACLAAVQSLGVTKLAGHDEATLDLLWPRLESQGWSRGGLLMMVFSDPPEIDSNHDVYVEVIDPARLACASSYKQLLAENDALDHWQMEVETEWRLGGEVLVGWLDGRPAGRCGWFVRDQVVRFRGIYTQDWARGNRVATTLIRYVQDHPTVAQHGALTIFSLPADQGGAERLYERLGFRTVGFRWVLRREA